MDPLQEWAAPPPGKTPTRLVPPREPFSLDDLPPISPELEAVRQAEATRLKARLQDDPRHRREAEIHAQAGVDYWRKLAGSYKPAWMKL